MHECLWEYDLHSRPEIFLSFRLLLVFFMRYHVTELDSLPFQVCLFYAKWGKVILFSFDPITLTANYHSERLLRFYIT